MTDKQEIVAEQKRLEGVFTEARISGDRERAVTASAALSAFIMKHNPPKVAGYASRAGQRQYNERTARYKR